MEKRRTPHRRKRRRRVHWLRYSLATLTLAAVFYMGIVFVMQGDPGGFVPHRSPGDTPFDKEVEAFAREQGLSLSAWPESLLEKGRENPELADFVLNYPLKKDEPPDIDRAALKAPKEVPALYQWDARWGYAAYAGGLLGLTGCGPTCLSMVKLYLDGDPRYDPRTVAEFAEEQGYGVAGSGSSWELISRGGEELGLEVIEIPLDKNRILKNLEAGNPIICVMGPGDFTTEGHFIVLTGEEDGQLRVNDPNSPKRTERLWSYEEIEGQIRNLWVCR